MPPGKMDPLCADIQAFCTYLEHLLDGQESEKLKKVQDTIVSFKSRYRDRGVLWQDDRTYACSVLDDMREVLTSISSLLKQYNAPAQVKDDAGQIYSFVCRIIGALAGANLKYNQYKKTGPLTTCDAAIEIEMKDYTRYKPPPVNQVKTNNAQKELQDAKRDIADLRVKLDSAEKANTEIQNKYTEQQKEVDTLRQELADLKKAGSVNTPTNKVPAPMKSEPVKKPPTKIPVPDKKPSSSSWFSKRRSDFTPATCICMDRECTKCLLMRLQELNGEGMTENL